MGEFSRNKGNRVEYSLVRKLTEEGLEAERVPLSGSMGGSFSGDVSLSFLGSRQPFEVKARADGFKEIYKWLIGAKGLFLKADRKDTLVVLRLPDFIGLMKAADRDAMLSKELGTNDWHLRDVMALMDIAPANEIETT